MKVNIITNRNPSTGEYWPIARGLSWTKISAPEKQNATVVQNRFSCS